MRLQLVFCPDTLHRAVRHAGVAAHAAHTPALAAFWRLGDLGNDPGNLGLGDGWPPAAARPVLKAAKAFLLEPLGPHRNAFCRRPQLPRHGFDALAIQAKQHNVGTLLLAHRACGRPRPAPQLLRGLRIRLNALHRPPHFRVLSTNHPGKDIRRYLRDGTLASSRPQTPSN